MSIDSLESQLTLVTDLCLRLVKSAPSTAYGSESMEQLIADQRNLFQVLIQGLRKEVATRDEKFERALSRTRSEQAQLETELNHLNPRGRPEDTLRSSATRLCNASHDRRIDHTSPERRIGETSAGPTGVVGELSELRNKLKGQLAELESLRHVFSN